MIQEFCDWLSATRLSLAFQSADWFVPSVQTVHIISIAILLTALYVMCFKLLVPNRGSLSLRTLVAKSTPWVWGTLLVLLLTGILLTITEPARELLNWAFRIKMILVLVLAALLLGMQQRLRRSPDYWTRSGPRRHAGRAIGVFGFVLGAAIVTAGRWIAYV